ncbi:taurine catabolism dioxygenase [Rhizoclosmatium globosum]|uniref:Taurine catabolism dioxygenase n=1 Tax=Rhizoclosmatium globosum TaxID=329046 RepID=A0A1Y2CN19_9FUNG|nr:taurine catabolism dioxygenase [Rhizoclosmatium globosum]|eukprot:ORY47735.1 taurine catabolism dioxygenase [Rhizoclosmatium globosum]
MNCRIQIRDLLNAPNSDELLLDLAVLISERGVVFLRDQDLTFEEQKDFANRLGKVTGKPATSGLHSHPINKNYAISSELDKTYTNQFIKARLSNRSELHSQQWHSDVTFEPIPSDYAVLRLREVPPRRAYEVYERLSPAFRIFLEGLTATTLINPGPRGAPEDVGTHLSAVHPVIRTNPVTGWKGINELSKDESDLVLQQLFDLAVQNHDVHVRHHWNKNDVAVWDNRSTFHAATADFDFDQYLRLGERAASLGERPYFDPNSKSRREALVLNKETKTTVVTSYEP